MKSIIIALVCLSGCAVGEDIPNVVRHVHVDPTFSIAQKIDIRNAMLNWESETMVRFVEGENDILIENTIDPVVVDAVRTANPGRVGWTTGAYESYIVRLQILSGKFEGKYMENVVTHELGHALGARFTDLADRAHCIDKIKCADAYMYPGMREKHGPVSMIDVQGFNRHSLNIKGE